MTTFEAHFFIEHEVGYQTEFYAQWLTDAGLGVPDIDKYEATLWVQQSGTTWAMGSKETIKESSAFRFEIDDDDTIEVGQWAARITTSDTLDPNSTDINYQIAVGYVHVMQGEPR